MDKKLIVYGASGHGKVVADAALRSGWTVLGFVDDDPAAKDRRLLGLGVLAAGMKATLDLSRREQAQVVVAIGDNAVRERVFRGLADAGVPVATIVHPSAAVADSASLGRGTVVLAQTAVNPDCRVGENVIINTGTTVDHDNRLGDHVHLSPGSHLGGGVRVGEGTHVGIGVAIRNNVSIGEWSVVGAGSVVLQDVPKESVAYGSPARVVREHRREVSP